MDAPILGEVYSCPLSVLRGNLTTSTSHAGHSSMITQYLKASIVGIALAVVNVFPLKIEVSHES